MFGGSWCWMACCIPIALSRMSRWVAVLPCVRSVCCLGIAANVRLLASSCYCACAEPRKRHQASFYEPYSINTQFSEQGLVLCVSSPVGHLLKSRCNKTIQQYLLCFLLHSTILDALATSNRSSNRKAGSINNITLG